MTRVALYARYSSDLQSVKSIEDQLALLREESTKRKWCIVTEYRDEATSGASMHGRTGLESMLSDAKARRFDIVFAEALDRLSRDQSDTAFIHKLLEFYGVRIVTLSEGDVQPLHIGFKGLMNSQFLDELGRKVRRGLMGRIAEGKSAGGLTYGYRPVPGETRGLLEIVPAEAETVRRIFREFGLDNVSPRAIAARLNAESIAGPRGGEWRASTINGQAHAGNGILNNELYIGRRIWNRRRKKKDPETGRARMFPNPPDQWRTVDVPDLRIVPDELWQAAKARQSHSRQVGVSKSRRPTRLLSGLLECGCCHGPMTIVGGTSYGCSNRREKGTCTNARSIMSAALERRVIEGLRSALLEPEAQRAAALEFHLEIQRLQKERRGRRTDLERDIAELKRRLDRGIDELLAGTITHTLKASLRGLEDDLTAKQAELKALGAEPVRLHPNSGALYAEAVGKLAEIIGGNDPETAEARKALRGLITGIVLTPRTDGEGYEVDLRGDLAALLNGEASRVVGAGIGFEPMTFRL